MTTYVLIHAAATDSWYWHLLERELVAADCDVVAVDLPIDDDDKTLSDYADIVVDAIGDREDIVVVGHSFGGFTAPLVAERASAALLVMLHAQIPSPGETPGDWWERSGYVEARRTQDDGDGVDAAGEADPIEFMLHDTPRPLAEEALRRERKQSGTPFEHPWPLQAWPDVPTRVLLSSGDRFFPLEFMRRLAIERLGIRADVMPGDHCPMLGHPEELAARLLAYHRAL